MNCTGIDWIIAIAFLALLTCSGWFCRRYVKGVADFLVAGRHMGKFLGLSTQSAEGITIWKWATARCVANSRMSTGRTASKRRSLGGRSIGYPFSRYWASEVIGCEPD